MRTKTKNKLKYRNKAKTTAVSETVLSSKETKTNAKKSLNTKKIAKTIEKLFLKSPDGFTIDTRTLKPIKEDIGFLVSLTDNEIKTVDENIVNKLLTTITSLSNPNACIGGWRDKTNGKKYLDVSIVIKNPLVARLTAIAFNQKACYSLEEKKVVFPQ